MKAFESFVSILWDEYGTEWDGDKTACEWALARLIGQDGPDTAREAHRELNERRELNGNCPVSFPDYVIRKGV